MEVSARVGLAIVHLYSCGNVSTLWQVDPLPEVERSAGRVWPKLWDCSWFFLRQSIPDLTLLILILKTYWKCRAAEYDPETTTSPWKGIEIWCRIPIELCCLAQLCRVCNCMGNFSCTAPYMILVNGTLLPRRQNPCLCQMMQWVTVCAYHDGVNQSFGVHGVSQAMGDQWPSSIFHLGSIASGVGGGGGDGVGGGVMVWSS